MLPRAEQKQQTRHALLDAARHLMESGRGFGSISLREVAKTAGIVPTGFYRHFADMDQLGLALVSEVGETFRETIRLVRHNELVLGGITDASVRIFLDVVAANRTQFLFLAREQYGGSLPVRKALSALREGISSDLAADLALMPKWQHLDAAALAVMADLVVKTVFATLPELIDPPTEPLPAHLTPQAKITQQLRFIFVGAKHWQGLGNLE
jgi:AcrR family transcriptional regulator